jgi:integrase/recombinase XerD
MTVGSLSRVGTAIATRLNAKGVGMRTIQKLMGHRNIGTTALYCDVSDETMRNAVELV